MENSFREFIKDADMVLSKAIRSNSSTSSSPPVLVKLQVKAVGGPYISSVIEAYGFPVRIPGKLQWYRVGGNNNKSSRTSSSSPRTSSSSDHINNNTIAGMERVWTCCAGPELAQRVYHPVEQDINCRICVQWIPDDTSISLSNFAQVGPLTLKPDEVKARAAELREQELHDEEIDALNEEIEALTICNNEIENDKKILLEKNRVLYDEKEQLYNDNIILNNNINDMNDKINMLINDNNNMKSETLKYKSESETNSKMNSKLLLENKRLSLYKDKLIHQNNILEEKLGNDVEISILKHKVNKFNDMENELALALEKIKLYEQQSYIKCTKECIKEKDQLLLRYNQSKNERDLYKNKFESSQKDLRRVMTLSTTNIVDNNQNDNNDDDDNNQNNQNNNHQNDNKQTNYILKLEDDIQKLTNDLEHLSAARDSALLLAKSLKKTHLQELANIKMEYHSEMIKKPNQYNHSTMERSLQDLASSLMKTISEQADEIKKLNEVINNNQNNQNNNEK